MVFLFYALPTDSPFDPDLVTDQKLPSDIIACAGTIVNLCLAGFVAAIRMTSLLGMGMIRNTYVTSLARFTMLHTPSAMTLKNAKAFRALLVITDENGNHLHVGSSIRIFLSAPHLA